MQSFKHSMILLRISSESMNQDQLNAFESPKTAKWSIYESASY